MEKNNLITAWLEEHGDPEIDRFIEKNLAITEKVRKALEAKRWTRVQLADAMDKKPSEVSKWLTGMHNLTLKSIIKMESVLGVDLIHCEPVKEYEYVYLGVIEGDKSLQEKEEEYTSVEDDYYSVAI